MNNVLAALRELYKAAVTADSPLEDIKTIHVGNPQKLTEDDLPALILQPGLTTIKHDKSGSQVDVRECEVKVTLVLNRKIFYASNYGEDDDERRSQKSYAEEKAADMIERINDAGHVDVRSVQGLIQNNQMLPWSGGHAASMCKVGTTQYDTQPPQPRGLVTYEAETTAVFTVRGNRA